MRAPEYWGQDFERRGVIRSRSFGWKFARREGLRVLCAVAAAAAWAPVGYAVCSDPVGEEGEQVYNLTYKVMQFCNGTNWISMASSYAGSAGGGVPAGAVMAFNLASCPDGWSEFTVARGRFLRGIDSTGTVDPAGVRAPGSTQEDELKSHSHGIPTQLSGGAGGNGSALSGNNTFKFIAGSTSTGGAETRPKNVAVLFCEKDA